MCGVVVQGEAADTGYERATVKGSPLNFRLVGAGLH